MREKLTQKNERKNNLGKLSFYPIESGSLRLRLRSCGLPLLRIKKEKTADLEDFFCSHCTAVGFCPNFTA